MFRNLSILSVLLMFLLSPTASTAADKPVLRLALLPIPAVLPVYVALEKGYFKEAGVEVHPLSVGSAVERDQLVQAGKADGMVNELSSTASFNREKNRVQVVCIARTPIDTSPVFRILAAPNSAITTAKDLAGIPVGISKNTIIEYVTTRMLSAAGLQASEIRFRSIPVLPERLQLLLQGQVQAVTLPDPLAASAIKHGAIEILNDLEAKEISASVLSFTRDALEEKGPQIQGFLQAWDRAVVDINKDPAACKGLMLKNIRVPGNIQGEFVPPPMPRRALPSREQWDDVMSWMLKKKLLKTPLRYEDSVTGDFLPVE